MIFEKFGPLTFEISGVGLTKAAMQYMTQAKSWAVGHTGERDGEDADNAKFYAQQAKACLGAPTAVNSADSMTGKDKIYVYTGETTDTFTKGHMYAWNGSEWEDFGAYGSGGSGGSGYDVESTTIAGDQSVTTEQSAGSEYASGSIVVDSVPNPYPDSLNVTLNDTGYSLPKTAETEQGTASYGNQPDDPFADYPLQVDFDNTSDDPCTLTTPEAGDYNVQIIQQTVSVSEEFTEAVQAANTDALDIASAEEISRVLSEEEGG